MESKINKIVIYENPLSDKIYAEFYCVDIFKHWIENEKPANVNVFADQVEVNGNILLGWDELGDFLN